MKPVMLLAITVFLSPLLLADDHHIDFDNKVDFGLFKTFVFIDGKVDSRRPEINSQLTLKAVGDAIRSELSLKGMTETQQNADLAVTFSISSLPLRGGTGPRGNRGAEGFRGTFAIDVTSRSSNLLVWRGVYTDDESTAAKLAGRLPSDAKRLLSEYPPKKKK